LTLAMVAAWSFACGGGSGGAAGGTMPPPSTLDVTGTWTGTASDPSGNGDMTWQLTQTGDSFSGNVTVTDSSSNYSGRGTVSGGVLGTLIHFTVTIPAGGFDGPWASCTASVSGDGQLSSTEITSAYSGSNSCSGQIAVGQLTLTKK
jgi:hypothetical protein